MQQYISKKFLVFKVNTFDLDPVNSQYYSEYIFALEVNGLTVLRFQIWLKATFFSSVYLGMTKKEDKSALFQTCVVFESGSHVDCPRMFWNRACYALK